MYPNIIYWGQSPIKGLNQGFVIKDRMTIKGDCPHPCIPSERQHRWGYTDGKPAVEFLGGFREIHFDSKDIPENISDMLDQRSVDGRVKNMVCFLCSSDNRSQVFYGETTYIYDRSGADGL